jgi:predicted ATPase/class 3 adenylate cyclase
MKTQKEPQAAEPIPPGTLTMLLTDVEGSTKLWEEHPDAMRRAIRRHHELAYQAIEQHGGYRPPDQGEGDSVFAVFSVAPSAVACALDFQRALAAEPWPDQVALRVRMALHTGALELRDGRNYAGLALNRCARLRAIAHGGQVILSEATCALTAPDLPAGVLLQDLGVHRLTDLSLPERVFQLCHPDLPAAFPPLRSLDTRPHNLPLQLTRFVGRAREMEEVRSTVRSSRLVTLTGTGGSGKTRLALRVAADLLEEHPDGTWFVELAGTADPALVPRVVSSTIGIREQHGRPILDTLVHHLATKAALLVLDNCEHLLDACAALADRLLRTCARLTVLATSREPLGIVGEAVRRVPPLSVPAADLAPRADAVASFEAVQLFVDRAVAAEPRFSLTDANAAAVVAICRRLEGIPLALELAAARLQALTIEQLRDRLEDRFRLLTGGSRTALPRQQTLRAAVDWSHDLLTEPERILLRRLSVFAGGFSLDAAEQVCGDRQVAPEDVLDLLTRLVSRSLALLETGPAGGRYRLLETIREYALGKLRAAGEEPELRRRHLQCCIGFAEPAVPALCGPDQQAWLDRLQAELDNFRAAFGWSLRQQAPGPALRLASALLEFWVVRADWSEGLEWVERALGLPGEVDPAIRMKALRAAAELADVLSDYARSTAYYEESLGIARALGDQRAIAVALDGLAHEAQRVGRIADARPLIEESVALLRGVGDEPSIARSLGGLAWLAGNYTKARALWNENLAIRRRLGNRESVGWSVIQVGHAAQGEGDYAAARAAYEESLSIGRDLRYKRMIARSLTQLAEVALCEGKAAAARGLFEETLPIWEEIGHKSGLLDSLRGLGDVARQGGDLQGAESYLRQSLAVCRAIGSLEGEAQALQSLGAVAMSRGDLDGAESLHREALALWNRMEHLDGIAASLRALGAVAAAADPLDRAARLLGASEALRERVGGTVPPWDRAELERAIERLRSGLGAEAFSREWEAGRQCTVEEAVGLSLKATPASAKDEGVKEEAPEGPSVS